MNKYNVEVEYNDDGASMVGASCGTLRRAEIFTVNARDRQDVIKEVQKHFKEYMDYCSIQRVGNITEIDELKQITLAGLSGDSIHFNGTYTVNWGKQ
jgi:hypothetical protein